MTLTFQQRLQYLIQHGDYDPVLVAAVLGLDLATVEHMMSDPTYEPPSPGGGGSQFSVWIGGAFVNYNPTAAVPVEEAADDITVSLAGGPYTLFPGSGIGAEVSSSRLPAGASLSLRTGYAELSISDATGSQKLSLESLGMDFGSGGQIPWDASAVDERVGTDLSLVDTQIVSAAGGQFWATFVCTGFKYTPA